MDRTGQDPAQLAKTGLKMERLAMPDVANTTPKSEISTLSSSNHSSSSNNNTATTAEHQRQQRQQHYPHLRAHRHAEPRQQHYPHLRAPPARRTTRTTLPPSTSTSGTRNYENNITPIYERLRHAEPQQQHYPADTTPIYEHLRHAELLWPVPPFAGNVTASQLLQALRNLARRAAAVYSGPEPFIV